MCNGAGETAATLFFCVCFLCCSGAPNDLDLFKASTKDSASDIAALNTAGLVVLGAAKVGGAPNTAGGYATGLSVSSTASQR